MTSLVTLRKQLDALTYRAAPPRRAMSRLELAATLGLTLDPWQHAALESEARQLLLNVCRQGGKSTLAAVLGIHEAISRPNALVLAVSPGERQSKLLFKTSSRVSIKVPAPFVISVRPPAPPPPACRLSRPASYSSAPLRPLIDTLARV